MHVNHNNIIHGDTLVGHKGKGYPSECYSAVPGRIRRQGVSCLKARRHFLSSVHQVQVKQCNVNKGSKVQLMSICSMFRKYLEASYEIQHRQKAPCLSASGHFLGVPSAKPLVFTVPESSVLGVTTIAHIVP